MKKRICTLLLFVIGLSGCQFLPSAAPEPTNSAGQPITLPVVGSALPQGTNAASQTAQNLATFAAVATPGASPLTPGYYSVVCNESLSLRSAASTAAFKIAILFPGEFVKVIDDDGTFAKVEAPGHNKTGYVMRSYLTPAYQPLTSGYKNEAYANITMQAKCKETLSMRAEPSFSGTTLTIIRRDETVELLGFKELFAKVRYKNQEGYVQAGYLVSADVYPNTIVKITEAYTYERMQADLLALQAKYPNTVKLASAGKSENGKELYVLTLGDTQSKKRVLVQASIHAREHMTTLLVMAQTEYMLAKGLPTGVCFDVFPMLNPDGVQIAQGSYSQGFRTIYDDVKNRNATSASMDAYAKLWKANGKGIDLNRNFDAGFGKGALVNYPASERYAGKTPLDQAESKAIAEYANRYTWHATLSYHAYGSLIYWNYGNSATNVACWELGNVIASVTNYPLTGTADLDAGGFRDWMIEKKGVPSMTIEVGTRDCPLPVEEFYTIWLRNRNVLYATGEYVLNR